MTDFEKIKNFFLERVDNFVHYKVLDKSDKLQEGYLSQFVYEKIINDTEVDDFFAIEFPFTCEENLHCIDSLDSFTFDFYFLSLGDKIVITDAERTFECGVEAFEGNGVLAEKLDRVREYLERNGMELNEYAIIKQTSIHSFVSDAITFTRVLQTLNNIQPYPPYILELDEAREVEEVLTRAWIKNESIAVEQNGRKLALFDNHKTLVEKDEGFENCYPVFYNKHAFVGIFFNKNREVLLSKKIDGGQTVYDFAVKDFVLKDESFSLEGLQRRIKECFGFDFFFGEIAPKLTTIENKVITDYYIVDDYDVLPSELSFDSEKISYEWGNKEKVFSLIELGEFSNYSLEFINYIYQIRK